MDSGLEGEQGRAVQVRGKVVRLREELGLLRKVECEVKEYWAIL